MVEMRNKKAEMMIAFLLVLVACLTSTLGFSCDSGVAVFPELVSSRPLEEAVRLPYSADFSF